MSAIAAVWKNGQVVLEGAGGWPEGCRLVVREDAPADIVFMTEEEQGDDEESIRRWIEDLRSLPPVPVDPERDAEWRAWEARMREFNIEAVRRQFEQDTP